MRGAIAWSYDLLDPAERVVFGGWRCSPAAVALDDAEAVVAAAGPPTTTSSRR